MLKRRNFWLIPLLLMVGMCGTWAAVMAEIVRYGEQDEAQPADAIIVLGAAVRNGRPTPVFRARINHAILLYEQGYADTIIFTGGIGFGDEISEAEAARDYAVQLGVPATAILLEETSTSTLENLANAQRVAAEAGHGRFLIVSNPFHMKRSLQMAADLGMEAYSSPTRTTRWISPVTYWRAIAQETVSYFHYQFIGKGRIDRGGR
jgi:uncharacterized SAM-binding protein YcdF (DUF218 family)